MVKLTDKQKRFCDEYLIDMNATQAAIRAGYSEKTAKQIATENLSKPYLQEYIQKAMAEKDNKLIATQDEVLQTLTRVLRREATESIVVTCKERKSNYDENNKKIIKESEKPLLVEIPTKISDVNKAAELLGKRYGLFSDKVTLDGKVEFDIGVSYGDADDKGRSE